MFNPQWYKEETKSYFEISLDRQVITYCWDFSVPAEENVPTQNAKIYTWPYPQPYKPALFENTRDPIAPYIDSDMFYVPYQAKSWGDQIEKWVNLYFWQFTILFDVVILTTNFVMWLYDLSGLAFTTPRYAVFPSMYGNAIAKTIF